MKILVLIQSGGVAPEGGLPDVSADRLPACGREPSFGFGGAQDEVLAVRLKRSEEEPSSGGFVLVPVPSDGQNLFEMEAPAYAGEGFVRKAVLEYAILNSFEAVIVLPGFESPDGKIVWRLLAAIRAGAAACVAERRGRRTLPCLLAERLLGMPIADPWEPCRAYAVGAVRQIPFQACRDNGHFDFEILVQMARAGLKIEGAAVDCVTHTASQGFGSRLLRTVGAAVSVRLHDMGIFYRRKYDRSVGETRYDLKIGYPSSHSFAAAMVEAGARVLDLACGPGDVALILRDKKCRVVGVDRRPADPARFEKFVLADLDWEEPFAYLGEFDWILALDCLEHLDNPERFISFVRRTCHAAKPRLLVTVPNIGFLPVRAALLFGQFNYGRMGILDLTHKRLFTFKSLQRALEEAGCVVESMSGIPAPYAKVFGKGFVAGLMARLNSVLIRLAPGLFSYQIAAVAHFRPVIRKPSGMS